MSQTERRGLELAALRGDLSLPGEDGWREVGTVGGLYIYPVKSMAAQPVASFSVCETGARAGLVQDRQLMVVDTRGKMVTARRYPNMVLIRPSLSSTHLTLSYPDLADLSLEVSALVNGQKVPVSVWGEECEGVECEAEDGRVSAWLSSVILGREDRELRLVCHQAGVSRPPKQDNKYLYPLQHRDKDRPLYADGYPYLLLSQPSIKELNTVLQEAGHQLRVEETRFRPNILVTGEFPAFSEDKWVHIKIRDSIFRNVKLCTRCNYTTVDPSTGEKHSGGEPLKTLKTFRSSLDEVERKEYGTSPFFGVNLGVEAGGEISVGDPVWISSGV